MTSAIYASNIKDYAIFIEGVHMSIEQLIETNVNNAENRIMNFDQLFYSILRSPKGQALERKADNLVCKMTGEVYPIINGIPSFVTQHSDMGQSQVEESFSFKWTKTPGWGITSEGSRDIMTPWMMDVLGWSNEENYKDYISNFRIILDAGCGNGRETIRIAKLNPEALVIGLDLSEGLYKAAHFSKDLPNVRFVRADLCNPPFMKAIFDYAISFGVLHHTPNTQLAFKSIASLIAPKGEFTFYVYRKKAPLREYADDYIRNAIKDMKPEVAWEEMEKITLFGKALSELEATIDIPEIKTLGIEGGQHNLQRLMYYTVLKCYWNNNISFEENVHVNYDWYAPQYAWRHTFEEIQDWIKEVGLETVFTKTIPAGFTFRVKNDCKK